MKKFEVVNSLPYLILSLVFGLVILFVSMTRASFELMAKEDGEAKLRVSPVVFVMREEDGAMQEYSYKLPEVKTLPNNPFYGFKKLRDYLWLSFSQGDVKKAKTAFLLADKKMAEARELIIEGEIRIALEASQEGLEKLKYADTLLSRSMEKGDEVRQMREEIYLAGMAYGEIVKEVENGFDKGGEKYNKVKEDINEFNQKIKKEREERSI